MSDETVDTQDSDVSAEESEQPKRCREHSSGLWLHSSDHDCPVYLRGANRNVRRMRP